jgi:hypothetical protein
MPKMQLRALYRMFLLRPDRFDEFRRMIATYEALDRSAHAKSSAAFFLARLNRRMREWLGGDFVGIDSRQARVWTQVLRGDR